MIALLVVYGIGFAVTAAYMGYDRRGSACLEQAWIGLAASLCWPLIMSFAVFAAIGEAIGERS